MLANLRRHVERASERQLLLNLWVVAGSEAEISKFNLYQVGVIFVLVFAQNVLKLYVAVHYVLPMHEVECEKDLVNDTSHHLLGHALSVAFFKLLHQVSTCHELCHNEEIEVILHELKYSCNVWMRGLFQNLKLIFVELDEDLVPFE